MGTRSLTIVRNGFEKKSPRIVTMYKQYDGYPKGYGADLANFLAQFTIVNGLSLNPEKVANGVGCLAAQIVAHFKLEPGGIYLEVNNGKPGDSNEEYIYTIYADTFNAKRGIELSCYDVYAKKEIFYGAPKEFLSFANVEAEETDSSPY